VKILGKYKDYYDYLQGIYGVDPLLTFDRRYEDMLLRRPDEEAKDKLISKYLWVAGKRYSLYYYNGATYYTLDELNNLNDILTEKKQEQDHIRQPWKYSNWSWKSRNKKEILTQEWWDIQNAKPTNLNIKLRNPVLISTNTPRGTKEDYSPCILKQWDFHKVMSAEEAYKQISAMMGYFVDHPVIPNKQSNIEKLLSHGFDNKKSFRHRK